MQSSRPLLLITLGDVAGIGPEIVARAWPVLAGWCRPVVVGDPLWLRRGLDLVGAAAEVVSVDEHLVELEAVVGAVHWRGRARAYTVPQDMAGLPACAVPAGVDDLGMPIGVQLTGPAGSEQTVLAVAEALHACQTSLT